MAFHPWDLEILSLADAVAAELNFHSIGVFDLGVKELSAIFSVVWVRFESDVPQ